MSLELHAVQIEDYFKSINHNVLNKDSVVNLNPSMTVFEQGYATKLFLILRTYKKEPICGPWFIDAEFSKNVILLPTCD